MTIVDETAAWEVARVSSQLPGHSSVSLASIEVIDGADIIQPSEHIKGQQMNNFPLRGLTHPQATYVPLGA